MKEEVFADGRRVGAYLDRIEPLAKSAQFDARTNSLTVVLKNGATFSVPKKLLPKPFSLKSSDLSKIQIWAPGTTLYFTAMDDGIHTTMLLEWMVGAEWIRYYASVLAGSVKSEKKAAAARKNGAAGGRPRKTAAA